MKNFYYYDTPWWNYSSGVSKVIVGENITTIGNYAFYGFSKLTDISLGSNIVKIGEYAFYECIKLETIGVLNQLTEIGSYAFGNCSKLTSFPGGDKLVTIGSYAFQSCSGLGNLILSDSLTTVESNAFASAAVNILHIGKKLDVTFADRLMPCKVNGTITVSAENPNFVVQNNVLMNPDKSVIIKAGAISGDYAVAAGVTKIASMAFYGKSITSVTLPEGLKEIGEQAFNSCNYLSEITVPVSVVKIGSRAFLDRTSFVIKGYTNTIAEKYCADGGYTFVSLGEAPVSQIKVTNSIELSEALQSPVTAQVILADGVYAFEEPISIDGAYNLTITAENPGKAEILTFDGYQPVLKIENSENVTVTGIILGHFSLVYRSGNCGNGTRSGGYVVYCYDSENITVDNCDLYGCGTYAAYLSYTGSFNIKNSVLRDCSEGIIYSYGYSYGSDENVII